MTDESIERQMWETFARCVPDDDTRRAVALRFVARQAVSDPRSAAARAVLAGAAPEDLDAAFARAVQRRSFTPTATPPADPQPVKGRIGPRMARAVADLDAIVERLTSVFAMPLVMTPATVGPGDANRRRPETFGPAEPDDDNEQGDGAFRFAIPDNLAAVGLAPRGTAELHDGVLDVRVRTRVRDALPRIVVIAVADGKATDVIAMRQSPSILSATVAWDYPGKPAEVLLGVLGET